MKKIIGLILIMNAISACHSPNQSIKFEDNASNEDTWLYETDSIYPSQNNIEQFKEDCYCEKISLCVDDINRKFKDTVLNFRNYIKGNDLRRIVCNSHNRNKDLDDLICESKYVAGWHLETLNDMNYFSFVIYSTGNHGNTIVRLFWCDRKSKQALERIRFLVKNKRIIGINATPTFGEGFIPIEEYEYPSGGIRI